MLKYEMWTENCKALPVESITGGWVKAVDAEKEISDSRVKLANACQIALYQTIFRYLMAHEEGRWDGFEKALRHKELIQFYIAMNSGVVSPENIAVNTQSYITLHEATRVITDNLDTAIGFPLTGKPDYDQLVPAFFSLIHTIICDTLPKITENQS